MTLLASSPNASLSRLEKASGHGGFARLALFIVVNCLLVALPARAQQTVVANYGSDSLTIVDLSTGVRTLLTGGGAGSGPALVKSVGTAREAGGTIVVGQELSPSTIYRIQPLTGVRTVLSSASVGTGPNLGYVYGLAVEADGHLIAGGGNSATLFRIHPVSGDRSVLSSTSVGTGATMRAPFGIIVDPDGSIVFVPWSSGNEVIRVDRVTGNRTVVSSAIVGTGAALLAPSGIVRISSTEYAVLNSNGTDYVLRVDAATGNRSVISSATVGSGPVIGTRYSIAVDNNGMLYVADFANSCIVKIDPSTGNRTVVSSGSVGSGPAFAYPLGMLGGAVTSITQPPAPTISSSTTASATYGSAFSYSITASESPTSYSATGLPTGLSLNTSTGAITGTPTQSGSFTVTLGATNATGTGNATLTLSVAKVNLTVSGLTASNKPYDGTTTAPLVTSGASLVGVVAGDTVTLDFSAATATFASAAIGNGKTVTVSGLSLQGAQSANYTLTQPSLTADISAASATVTLSDLTQVYNGSARTVTATTTPAGLTVVLTYGGSATAPTNAGSYAITATINDATYTGSTSGTLVVTPASQTISFGSISAQQVGATVNLNASASSGLAVAFSVVSGPGTLSGNVLTTTGEGTIVVRASQAGNSNYAAASAVEQSVAVGKTAQTVTFSAIPSATVGVPVTLTATASSGLAVTFSVVSGNAMVSGNTLTVTGGGAVTVRATQAGDNQYASAFADQSIAGANQVAQTITFDPPATKLSTDAPFTLTATASSGLPVSFTVLSGNGILGGDTLTLTAVPGSVTVRASQAGNASYAAATPVDRTITILPVGPQIFFGNLGASLETGRVAAVVAKNNNEGTLIGYLPGTKEGFVVPFSAANGVFRQQVETFSGNNGAGGGGGAGVTFSMPSRRAATDAISTVRIASSLAQPTRTFSGNFSNGVITGTIEELGISFVATLLPQGGETSDIAGYYAAPSVETATGGTHAVVGTRGELFVLAITRDNVEATAGQISAAGAFSVQTASNIKVEGKVDTATTTVKGAITAPGKVPESFQGLSGATQRTDRLMNLSARTRLQAGDTSSILITGFVVDGPAPKQILLRGVGPALNQFGLSSTLANPHIRVFAGSQIVAENDDWSGGEVAQTTSRVGAFTLPVASKDAAMLMTLNPGAYTVHLSGGNGIALLEMYDASENPQGEFQRLVNVSARGAVSSGEGVLIGGFIVSGNSPKRVLVRGIGPGLTKHGVSGVLSDPLLSVFSGQTVIAKNDNWETPTAMSSTQTAALSAEIAAASAQVGGFALDAGSKDASLIVVLAPGAYTAQVGGANGATGVALIEVYEIPE